MLALSAWKIWSESIHLTDCFWYPLLGMLQHLQETNQGQPICCSCRSGGLFSICLQVFGPSLCDIWCLTIIYHAALSQYYPVNFHFDLHALLVFCQHLFLGPRWFKGINIEYSLFFCHPSPFLSELCRSLMHTEQTSSKLDGSTGNRKPPRKGRKKSSTRTSILKTKINLSVANMFQYYVCTVKYLHCRVLYHFLNIVWWKGLVKFNFCAL